MVSLGMFLERGHYLAVRGGSWVSRSSVLHPRLPVLRDCSICTFILPPSSNFAKATSNPKSSSSRIIVTFIFLLRCCSSTHQGYGRCSLDKIREAFAQPHASSKCRNHFRRRSIGNHLHNLTIDLIRIRSLIFDHFSWTPHVSIDYGLISMWLIDTSTLKLNFVTDADEQIYAILSHTWTDDEVSFQDMADLDRVRLKEGFEKIYQTCELARSRRIQYAWVDTCCIDKQSSAELTEAINSMFQWYRKAAICFVYLSDFVGVTSKFFLRDHLSTCRWFTRGWTLQELIASQAMEFYNQQWNKLGNKRSLQSHLSHLTGVDAEILEDCNKLNTIPVARRMCWAANRTTTRKEDIAYCLFGIFDVNLPLIYGEGLKAFIRLQEAIARETTDLSLFAWESPTSHGAFAESPSDFQKYPNIASNQNLAIPSKEFTITNKGLRFETILYEGKGEYRMKLHCRTSAEVETSLALRLAQTARGYVRLGLAEISSMDESWLRPDHETPIYIPKTIDSSEFEQFYHFRFQVTPDIDDRFTCHFTPAPTHLWDTSTNSFITSGQSNFIGMIDADVYTNLANLREKHHRTSKIVMLLRPGFRPWAGIFNTENEKTEFHPFAKTGNRSPSDQVFWDALRGTLTPLLEKGYAPTTLLLRPTKPNDGQGTGVWIRFILDVKLRPSNPITPYELIVRVQKA